MARDQLGMPTVGSQAITYWLRGRGSSHNHKIPLGSLSPGRVGWETWLPILYVGRGRSGILGYFHHFVGGGPASIVAEMVEGLD